MGATATATIDEFSIVLLDFQLCSIGETHDQTFLGTLFSGKPEYFSEITESTMSHGNEMLQLLGEVYTLEKYHKSMVDGLMVYGMMRAIKK